MKRVAVVPAYKPSVKMLELLDELVKNKYDVVLVDDGSGDNYKKIFKRSLEYATVLRHEVNKGKGAALKTAFRYIKDNYDDCGIVTVDCDFQHRIVDANKLIESLDSNPDKLIIGKRIRSGKTPLRSRIGNAITRAIYRIVTGVDVYDTQSGLRAFSSKLIDFMLEVNGCRFEYEMNVLLACASNSIKVREVTIETIYINDNKGSHFKAFRDSFRIYGQILKFSMVEIITFILNIILYIGFYFELENPLICNILALLITFIIYIVCFRKKCSLLYFLIITFNMIIFYLLSFKYSGIGLKIYTDFILLCIFIFYRGVFIRNGA